MSVVKALSAFEKRPDTFEAAAREVLTYIQKTGAEIAFCLSAQEFGLMITPTNRASSEALDKVRDAGGGHDVQSGIALIKTAMALGHQVEIREAHKPGDQNRANFVQSAYGRDLVSFLDNFSGTKFKVTIGSVPQVA